MGRGQGEHLSREALLNVELSSICSRNRYTTDPAPVIDELLRTAGKRTDILAEVAGTWAGYYADEHTRVLATALLEIPGAAEWVELGRRRRGTPPPRTP